MPTLKQVNCFIELGSGNTKIKEYGARYSDGHVETFIPVPVTNIPFTIHLTTNGYIAPGIAFFVFMDGEYQCNRNRQGLQLPGDGILAQDYETEFRVRQKEEKTSFGSFVAREWTFAKLNRVAADKAPNLNPQFTNNVGTIEVIVLRCKSDADNFPPPREIQTKPDDKPGIGKKAKRSAAPAPAASAKASTAQDDMLAGMFGLFDGACDAMNLDGAVDVQSVHSDRGLSPECRAGTVYDPVSGHWIPASVMEPPTEIREACELSSGMRQQVEAIERNVQDATAQLDGHGGQPGVVINQWGDRARDDMRGDKCLGLEFETRSAYKQYLRETGQSVSSHAHNAQQDYVRNKPAVDQRAQPNPYYHHQPHQQPAEHAAPRPDSMNIAQKLEVMRQRFEYLLQSYPHHKQAEAQRNLDTVIRLQRLQQQGQGGFKFFPTWLVEYLTDLEVKRQYIMRLQQNHPMMDFSPLKHEFENLQIGAILNPTLHKEFSLDELDQAREMYSMFAGRVDLLEKFVNQAESFSKLSTHDLRARIEFVTFQRDKARDVVRSVERRMAQNRDGVRQAQGWPDPPAGIHTPSPQAVDGAPQCGWPSAGPADGKHGGFNQIGSGEWKPHGQDANLDSWVRGDDGFDTKQQGQWPDDKNEGNRSNAAQNWGGQADNNWNAQRSDQHGGSKDANGQRNGSNSKKTHEHDFSNSGDKKSEQFHASRSRHSSHQSNNNNGWNGNKNQQPQVDGNWAGNGGSKRSGNDAWGGGSKHGSRSANSRTAIRVSNDDPTAYIKPYWKDWNKPFDREVISNAAPKKVYEEPREVYTYPAPSLPPVPKKAVKEASYGIQAGRGADYTHKTHRPVYIDTMERPYAVFSFKYRSKEALEKILRIKVDDSEIKKVQKLAEEARLSALPKHKLVEELMAKRAPPKSSSKKDASDRGSKAASAWGGDKKGSERGGGWNDQGASSNSASSKSSSKKSNQGWDQGGNGNNADNGWNDGGDGNDANDGWGNNARSKTHSSKKNQNDAAAGWASNERSKGQNNNANGWDDSGKSKNGSNDGNNWAAASNRGKSAAASFAGW